MSAPTLVSSAHRLLKFEPYKSIHERNASREIREEISPSARRLTVRLVGSKNRGMIIACPADFQHFQQSVAYEFGFHIDQAPEIKAFLGK